MCTLKFETRLRHLMEELQNPFKCTFHVTLYFLSERPLMVSNTSSANQSKIIFIDVYFASHSSVQNGVSERHVCIILLRAHTKI